MILVDSTVWIDYFNGIPTPQTELLDRLLETEPLAIGDLILAEVLQGFGSDKDVDTAKKLLKTLTVIPIAGEQIAIQAAKNFRTLRRHGVTIRKTIDTLIATRCIEDRHELLHNDRDFEPFSHYLGLKTLRTFLASPRRLT